jgi:NAD(P)H-hydrate epimerase
MKVVTVEQMRAIERETDAAGVSYAEMMENAGRATARAIADRIEKGDSVVILVGPGNNGGDGLVAGRYLAEAGVRVAFYLFKPRPADDPLAIKDRAGAALHAWVKSADVLVDAVLGTGADRPIAGALETLLQRCAHAREENRRVRAVTGAPLSPARLFRRHAAPPLVVAVDCPSGLNCNTGALDPVALPADLTVTFAAPKVGQFLFPGAAAVGELLVADIGSPDDLPSVEGVELELATADAVRDMLPARPLEAHKGTFGKVMIVAGSINYTGAAALAAQGAYRAGAGLVTLAIPGSIHAPLAAQVAEATFLLLPHELGAINENGVRVLLESIADYDALLIGPGIGRDERTRHFLEDLLAHEKAAPRGRIGFARPLAGEAAQAGLKLPPLVVDADGLNLLTELNDWPERVPPGSILTPHPGEMARLMKCDRDEVNADRIGAAQGAAADWGQVIVLKGAFTVIAAPDGRTTLLPFANPALATAGSGDVLAGAIVALLGAGLEPYPAAVAGAFVHGAAGRRAAQEIGSAGVAAGDLPRFVAAVLSEMGA